MLTPSHDRGSILLLFPAAVLVMVVLSAIAVDVGYTQVRARELQAMADSAANDVLAALDVDALRAGGGIRIDPGAATHIVGEAIAAGPHPDTRLIDISVASDPTGDARDVFVTLQLDIELVFAPALGELDRVTLTRTGRAVILRG